MENNSTDPEFIKKNFEALQQRFRQTGVSGVTESDGTKRYADEIVDKEKEFQKRKDGMTVEGGVATFKPSNTKVPNARPRRDVTPPSSTRVFALGETKPKSKKGK